jgi:hypothetical protein
MTVLQPVQVIRYVRPRLENGTWSNLGGATFVFTMDYNTRTVRVQHALCSSKDNFNKALGLKTALASGFREVDLDLFQGFADKLGGFVNAYQMMLSTFSVAGMLSPSESVFIKKWMAQGLNEQ